MEAFDHRALEWIATVRTEDLTGAMRFVTTLGDTYVAVFFALLFVFLSIVKRTYSLLASFLIAVLGAILTADWLKIYFERPRPVDGLAETIGFAFPSGHATTAFAVYGFLAILLIRMLETRVQKYLVALSLGILVFTIGFSRIYLGVHYPTDVLAGFAIGAIWLFIGEIFADLLSTKPLREVHHIKSASRRPFTRI